MKVGVFGLGRMGGPIAAVLAERWDVVTYDPLVAPGDPVAIAAGVDALVTVLPGAAEVRELGGVVAALRADALWLDLTSADPRVYGELGHPRTVGAPMAGGPGRPLRFFVGGSDPLADELLDALGTRDPIGPHPGDGQSAKLVTNLLWFGQVVAVSEALLLAQSLGLDPHELRRTLSAGAAQSAFVDDYADRMLAGDPAATFGLDRVVEELDTLTSLAREHGVPFELSTLVARLHREALERFGPVDGELLAARLLQERAGRQF